MKTIKKIQTILLSVVATGFAACSDYLDVSKELSNNLDMEQAFNNVGYTRNFHSYIYTGIPDMSNIIINSSYAGLNGLDNPWPTVSDELKAAQNNVKLLPVNGYNAGSADLSRWSLYKQIRQANLFLEKAHAIEAAGDVVDKITETQLADMKNEARFLRAYYHYLLFELYGAIPIMNYSVDPNSNDLDFYRAPLDSVVSFIDRELTACMPLLPDDQAALQLNNEAVPTKVAALAIKAKMYVYAASPLYNGGYPEAVALRDNQGVQLFPAKNEAKWQKAADALKTLIEYAESHHSSTTNAESTYGLYYAKFDAKGNLTKATENDFDPEASIYGVLQEAEDNPEILWASTKSSWGGVNGEGREKRCTPRAIYSGYSNVGILQEMVDDFFMKDGLPAIRKENVPEYLPTSPLYDTTTEYEVDNENVANMYKNREPRFYWAATYSGKRWQIKNTQIFFHKGSKDDNSSGDNCYTGTLLYKGMNKDLLNEGSYKKSQYRPGILFRMADFYLLYAEVLNRINPSDPRILAYVDKVRKRAGLPGVKELNPAVAGNQTLQEEAIRRERRVELFAEGQRYFDVRRWMTAESKDKQGGPFHAMDMGANNPVDFMKRIVLETRLFERRTYLYPIPLNEVQKSTKLVQNPGW